MLTIRYVVSIFSVSVMILGTGLVSGQAFPSKPIHIVTSEVGGASDFISRLIMIGLSDRLSQPVIVENRSGVVADELVSKASPDGHTLLVHGAAMYIGPLLQKANYDPADFQPVTIALSTPGILVVHPSLPVKSVKELIALAKARPGELNYAMGGYGGQPHIGGELFNLMAAVKIVAIPYRSSGPAIIALIGGQVHMMLTPASSVSEQVKAGRLRALAVTSAQPSELFPGLPTVAASLPGFELATIIAIFAPAKTPRAIISRLSQEIVRILTLADVRDKIFKSGAESVGNSPEEAAIYIKREIAAYDRVIKNAGIRVQ